MLTFINHKLHVIKQVHNQCMGGLDVIMTCDFYQVPPLRDSQILRLKMMDSIFQEYCFGVKTENVMN